MDILVHIGIEWRFWIRDWKKLLPKYQPKKGGDLGWVKLFRFKCGIKNYLQIANVDLANVWSQFKCNIDNDGNQSGSSLKDPLQVPDGPITRLRAKKIKEAMQGLVQSTWDEVSKSPTIKVGLKEGEPILIHLI